MCIVAPIECALIVCHRRASVEIAFPDGVEVSNDPLVGMEFPHEDRHLPFFVSEDMIDRLREISPWPFEVIGFSEITRAHTCKLIPQ